MQLGQRRVETSAIATFAPVVPLLPLAALALAAFWWPVQLVVDVSLVTFELGYLALGSLLFLRPVQRLVLTRLLGARRPDADERARLDTAWRSVVQAAGLPAQRYVLAVLPADDLNAFACGGHLVVVTSRAVDSLPRDELAGVLAHELSHHLGLHTVALTLTQWLSIPVLILARIGFFLQNVATAATSSYASHSAALTALGRIVAALLTAVSWVLLAGLIATNTIGNITGRGAEFQADERAVAMGFGRELSSALRRVIADGGAERPTTWRQRVSASHPSARTRVARIDAARRRTI